MQTPGFVQRQTLYPISDKTQNTSLLIWESEEIYDKWRTSPERAKAMAGAEELWVKPPVSTRFLTSG